MKRYYNNTVSGLEILGERFVSSSHNGLVHERLPMSGMSYTYEVDDTTSISAHVDIKLLSTDLSKIRLLKACSNKTILLARVVGLYKRSYKKKQWTKRRTIIKGRLLAVGNTLGILKIKYMLPREHKKILSRHEIKLMMWRSIGKLYIVRPLIKTKYGVLYKRVGTVIMF